MSAGPDDPAGPARALMKGSQCLLTTLSRQAAGHWAAAGYVFDLVSDSERGFEVNRQERAHRPFVLDAWKTPPKKS
jgi:hypothetical protein